VALPLRVLPSPELPALVPVQALALALVRGPGQELPGLGQELAPLLRQHHR
jgi:hypothetical protein